MKLSDFFFFLLGDYIAGNDDGWPYRSGPELVKFFNNLGFREVYAQGFPSRPTFAREKLAELNGKQKLKDAIRELLDPRLWLKLAIEGHTVESCAAQINEIVKFDGYEVVRDGNFYKVRELITYHYKHLLLQYLQFPYPLKVLFLHHSLEQLYELGYYNPFCFYSYLQI